MQNVSPLNFFFNFLFLSVPGTSLILFAIMQVVVFRSDGSVLLNEMTVNVPHVSGKGHSLVCHMSYTCLLMWRCIFFRGKSGKQSYEIAQILEQLGDEWGLIVITENFMGRLPVYSR